MVKSMTPQHASFSLLFETEGGVTYSPEVGNAPTLPMPEAPHHGWVGTPGPAIDWKHWPRSLNTGLPLMHVLTLWLPGDYQRKGPEYVGIAYFAECGEPDAAEPERGEADSDDPFLADLAQAVDHPTLSRRVDVLGAEHAIIWLTAEELARGPVAPHADLREEGEPEAEDTLSAWDNEVEYARLWLVKREDPNAGIAPLEVRAGATAENGYQSPHGDDFELLPWAEAMHLQSHLGGTAMPVQGMPEGLSPWYLELEEFGDLNYGGGNAQIDLETEAFDWAC